MKKDISLLNYSFNPWLRNQYNVKSQKNKNRSDILLKILNGLIIKIIFCEMEKLNQTQDITQMEND